VLPLKDENPTTRFPFVTVAILLACVAVYFLWQPTPVSDTAEDVVFTLEHAAIPCELTHARPLTDAEVRATFGSEQINPQQRACGLGSPNSPPWDAHKNVWLGVLESMFLHGSLLHLGGNMLFLWIFGNNIEDRLGHVRYALFYLAGGVAATAFYVALNMNSTVPMIGASGAIAAVMGAYLIWFPDAPVRTLIFLFIFVTMARIRAKWLLGFWFISQFFTPENSGVAWAAHVGGFVFGMLVALVVRASGAAQRAAFGDRYVTAGPWDSTGGHYRW
jgi:membrane associated rhomboid family serine protease